jgi:hypothetical protein
MQYLLMLYSDPAGWSALTPDQQEEAMAAYAAYTEALSKAEVLRGVHRLRPASSATSVRIQEGEVHVLDGPYAETREQLGGTYLIDVPDLDAALAWARRCPAAGHGTVEVRPVWT